MLELLLNLNLLVQAVFSFASFCLPSTGLCIMNASLFPSLSLKFPWVVSCFFPGQSMEHNKWILLCDLYWTFGWHIQCYLHPKRTGDIVCLTGWDCSGLWSEQVRQHWLKLLWEFSLSFPDCRYRNFRTFTSPRPVQFASLAVDSSGEVVCAGGQDTYEIYVWSMQTGRLLEVIPNLYQALPILNTSIHFKIPFLINWNHAFCRF